MKKKVLLLFIFVMALSCLFVASVGAADTCEAHTDGWTISLGEDGFLGDASAINKCSVCGTVLSREIIPQLFHTNGSSYSDNGIMQSYAVDRDALKRYEELSGTSIDFGVVAATRNQVPSGNPLDENGNPVVSKVGKVSYKESQYDIFEVVIKNIPDERKDAEIICCAYVNVDGTTHYLDNFTKSNDAVAYSYETVKSNYDTYIKNYVPKQAWNDDNTLKVLAIGNSFSVDSMEYLYQIATNIGVENVELGNLYIGGCSLATHLSNAQNDTGAYTYYTNSNGTWSSTGGVSIKTAVKSNDWDYITIQQVSGSSGITDTYNDLQAILDIVKPMCPSAKIVWNMTWAYKTGSGHSDFSKYNNNQLTMYNAILDAVNIKINTNNDIDLIIPTGTAIQNARTSYVGDDFTRDGYHLSDYGRYVAAITWAKALTGLSVDGVTVNPTSVSEQKIAIAIESANNAYLNPYAVTASKHTELDDSVLENLVRLELSYMGWTKSAYWNSDSGTELYSYANSSASNLPNFFATKKFTAEMLPVGSVIEIDTGWQYRPDRWGESRPNPTSTERVIVDESWWDNETARAFNISSNPESNISSYTIEEINAIFRIYVPASAVEINKPAEDSDDETTEPDDTTGGTTTEYDDLVEDTAPEGYVQLKISEMGLTELSYYWSEKQGASFYLNDANTAKRFFATGTFTKDTLPNGTIIEISSGWRYRPDGWIDGTKANSSSITRPDNVTTTTVVVDDAWWGDWTVRAFNISKTNNSSLESATLVDVASAFKIYIPTKSVEGEITEPAEGEAEVVELRYLTLEEMGLVGQAYWNSSDGNKWTELFTTADNSPNFFATKKFTKAELPNGSVITIASTWQYRPDGWINGAKNSNDTRPANVTTTTVVVDDAWWGSWTERGFNISSTNKNNSDLSGYTAEAIYKVFSIQVPVGTVINSVASEVDTSYTNVSVEGLQQLSLDDLALSKNKYWYSTSNTTLNSNNANAYFATRKFTKEELTVGTVIEIELGWQYRPEYWENSSTISTRPGNQTVYRIVVTEDWWDTESERGFNIGMVTGADISGDEYTIEYIAQYFKIYVPSTSTLYDATVEE